MIIFLKDNKIHIKSRFEDKDRIKELSERSWNSELRVWMAPLSILREVIKKFPDATIDDNLKQILHKDMEIIKLSSEIKDDNINIEFSDNLKLMPFQSIGVRFIEKTMGKTLIADDMGLGKSIEVLAYLRLHPELRPVLIIAPTSLKINWMHEAEKWLDSKDKINIINNKIELDSFGINSSI